MAGVICPHCNAENKGTAQFCAECGTPLLGGLKQRGPDQSQVLTKPLKPEKPAAEKVLQNRYRIEESLGRGGFGSVYRAWDLNLERDCAIKENLITSPDAQRQFMREATILSNLSHSNLPRVIDHFIIPGQGQYLVMDFVDGEDLESILERRELVSMEEATDWILQVTDALVYLHRQKPPIFHRDIKPANIRLTPDGNAMLVDFGLVKVFEPDRNTTQGARAITPGYAPPEQYGRGSTDARSDLYALGATFYALITGHEPVESVNRLTGKTLQPACVANPNVPQAVSNVIDCLMALEPSGRYTSAVEFREALLAALSQPQSSAGFPTVTQTATQHSVPATTAAPSSPSQPVETIAVSQPLKSTSAEAQIAAPDIPEEAVPQSKPKSKKRTIWLFAGLFLVIIAALGFVLAGLGNEDEDELGPVEQTLTAHAVVNSQIQATLTARGSDEATDPPQASATKAIEEAAPVISKTSTNADAGTQESTPEATATESAEVTVKPTTGGATEQARTDYLKELEENASLAYGPKSGRLLHKAQSGEIQFFSASTSARNFITEVTFISPYSPDEGNWDFGMLFRDSGNFMQYRLIFFSDQTWYLASYIGNPEEKTLGEGETDILKVEAGEQNKMRLYVIEDRGWVYLNDQLLTEFEASQHYSGGISIGVGFFEGQGITGKLTEYKDFTVWTLPINP